MDAPTAATDVRGLARVLFEVGPFDADADAAGQIEPAVDADRLVVLTDLVRLWHVGVEVVLAGERRALHRAVERQAEAHRELDGLAVEDGQRSGQAERDGIDVGVRFVTEAVRRRREQLRPGGEFAVDFESDDQLVAA